MKKRISVITSEELRVKSEKYKSFGFDVGACIARPSGITLITLVITIILLIILVGVVINLTLGENGLLTKTKQTQENYNEQQAKEKLELVLANARIEKETNTSYNDDYLNNMLEAKGITVDGNSVIVDNYNFLIDREQLIITNSLGETNIKVRKEVKKYLGKNANEKYEASLLLIVESNSSLQSVVITNPDGTTFEMQTEKTKLGKDMTVELDSEYIVTVTTKDGKQEQRKIVEKSEEPISTAQELAEFRDKVNTGLTYEGKTVKLTHDIDLSNICGANVDGKEINWEPIGSETAPFKGTFDGNNKNISNIYINTNGGFQGLFGYNKGTIQNIILNGKVKNNSNDNYTGGIVAYNAKKIINCCNNAYIQGYNLIGGIAGYNIGDIERCYNTGEINSTYTNSGGIVGTSNIGNIKMCYNTGYIHAKMSAGGICGYLSTGNMYNCYNIGNVYASQIIAGGINGAAGISGYPKVYTYNCYNIGQITSSSNIRTNNRL